MADYIERVIDQLRYGTPMMVSWCRSVGTVMVYAIEMGMNQP